VKLILRRNASLDLVIAIVAKYGLLVSNGESSAAKLGIFEANSKLDNVTKYELFGCIQPFI
jgi:hypothetical protein